MAYALVVLDASAALALVLAEDEGEEVAELINNTISINGQIFVPGLFWYEMGMDYSWQSGPIASLPDRAPQQFRSSPSFRSSPIRKQIFRSITVL